MIGDFLEKYTFDYLMNDALSRVNENIDTREGSIIYDALAPACYELAGFLFAVKKSTARYISTDCYWPIPRLQG